MAELRYVGTGAWNQAQFDDKGVYSGAKVVAPGEIVEAGDEIAKAILAAPRFHRNFVEVNGPEDRLGDNYGGNRHDVLGNAVAYPELDMGSTVTGGKAIFVTHEDNPEGFPVADPSEGPQSDNTELIKKAEVEAKVQKAMAEANKPKAPVAKPAQQSAHSQGTEK